MVREDDGFGPVLTGGDDDEGFGPVVGGSLGSRRPEGSRKAAPATALRPAPPAAPPVERDVVVGRHRRGRWVTRALSTLLVLLLVGIPLLALGLLATTTIALRRTSVVGLDGMPPPMNVLVIGSDSRDGLSPEELLAMGTEAVGGNRTDTLFLLSVDGGRAAMLSFPRDLYVTRCDGSKGRINAAFDIGGASCLVQTVSRTSGVAITSVVIVDLAGLKRLVDAVGGVTLHLDAPLIDPFAGIDLPAGCVTLDGTSALGYVRARHVDNDLGRIGRQQRFIAELADELAEPRRLVDVPRLFRVAAAAGGAVTADRGLGPIDLLKLGRAARGFAGAGLATYTVPAAPQTIGGAAVLVPGADAAALFASFRDGSVLDGDPSGPPPPPAPADGPGQAAPQPPAPAAPPPC